MSENNKVLGRIRWLDNKKEIKTKSQNFYKIINFYLFSCPVSYKDGGKVALQSVVFEELKICGSKLRKLLSKLKSAIKNGLYIYLTKRTSNDLVETHLMNQNKYENIFVFRCNARVEGQLRALLYHIRNAIAHNSFIIIKEKNKVYYYFANDYNSHINARIKISEKLLLDWIDIINRMMEDFKIKCLTQH